jgi:hypothetical protein
LIEEDIQIIRSLQEIDHDTGHVVTSDAFLGVLGEELVEEVFYQLLLVLVVLSVPVYDID